LNRNGSWGTTPSWRFGRVVEAGHQLGDRRLPRPGFADERVRLTRLDLQADVVQHRVGGVIAERHAVERDAPDDGREVNGVGRLGYGRLHGEQVADLG
jgi:hypothetical protein